jgi:hypothetical protein
MVLFHEPIPKKPPKDVKHCLLCKKQGDAHMPHNMQDCHKYDKESKLKKGFGKCQHGSTVSNKKTASTFAHLSAKFASSKGK